MNPLYDKMFNSQYVNENYIYSLQRSQYDNDQRVLIMKAVKAIHDYGDAARNIAPEYQEEAFRQCCLAVLEEMGK